jgi:DNA-directed RNA polymerase beta subunit
MEDINNKEIPLIINNKIKPIDFLILRDIVAQNMTNIDIENEKKSLVSIINSINSNKEINQGLKYALTTGEWGKKKPVSQMSQRLSLLQNLSASRRINCSTGIATGTDTGISIDTTLISNQKKDI